VRLGKRAPARSAARVFFRRDRSPVLRAVKARGAVVRVLVSAWLLAAAPCMVAVAQLPGHDDSGARLDWPALAIDRLPVLEDARTGRWPLVLWRAPDARGMDEAAIRGMLERGIAPTVKLQADYAEAARRIQAAGGPVIALQAAGGDWPYDIDGEGATDAGIDPRDLSGWRRASESLREQLSAFADAGVVLDAAWLDYENAPVNLPLERVDVGAGSVPEVVRDDPGRFRVYRRQLWLSLLSAYVAAPLREFFPRISLTNWVVSASRADAPLLDWYNRPHPRTDIGLFTATNPIAYGSDIAFAYTRPRGRPLDREAVDAIYTHILLRQVSADARARRLDAPHMESVVWVARWVRDILDRTYPVMSREAYREALRHIWLRGADAMMIFNPVRRGMQWMSVYEVDDAATVYREMLAFHELLDTGEVMNVEVPPADGARVFWSGVRTDAQAVVRVTNRGDRVVELVLSPWPGQVRELSVEPGAVTFVISSDDYSAEQTRR